jgi:hypothetical protein
LKGSKLAYIWVLPKVIGVMSNFNQQIHHSPHTSVAPKFPPKTAIIIAERIQISRSTPTCSGHYNNIHITGRQTTQYIIVKSSG